MYNWRLLIFAFFAVFQPIASFAERNLVDGRHQCCDHRISRDSGSFNGNYPFKLSVEDRHLNNRDIREVGRDDNRNERTVINGFRDARERQLNRDFDSRVSRIAFQRMNNRVAPRETRETQFRDSEINREERNFARDSLSRKITITRTDRQDIRNTERHVNRENNQREVLHQMPKDNTQVRRETRPELKLTADGDRDRRSYHGKSADSERRVSITRNDVRHQHLTTYRSTESLNRLERDNREYRRSSPTGYRVPNEDIRGTRNGAARNDVRISDRIDRDLKLSARSLERRGDNERFYRKTVVARNRNNEIRNFVRDERRMESRAIRENIERFEPTRRVAFRRVDSNREKNTERLAPAERSPVRHSRVENVESIRAATRRTTGEERREDTVRAYRMLTSRSENRENENRRERTHLMSRNRELQVIRPNSIDDAQRKSNRRTRSFERSYEQRTMRSERENGRTFDQSRLRDERQERRVINERALSLERERIIPTAQRMERRVTMERRLYIRNNMSEESRNNIITRNTESRRVDNRMKSARELTHNQIHKEKQNEFDGKNWQYLMYTMQGIYLCTIFLPMLMDKGATKKKMSLNWGASIQKLIKVD